MNDEDDTVKMNEDEWFRILTGKEPLNANGEEAKKAGQIRQTILSLHKAALDQVKQSEIKAGKQRLLFRLQQERLLKPGFRMTPVVGMALAACLAMLVVLVPLVKKEGGKLNGPGTQILTPPVIKNFVAPQVIYRTDPLESAVKLEKELTDLGVEVKVITENDSLMLVVKMAKQSKGLSKLCDRWNLQVPHAMEFAIEIIKK